jgi:hypothetical protein
MTLARLLDDLPDDLRGRYVPVRAQIAKVGAIDVELTSDLIALLATQDGPAKARDLFIRALYDAFESSELTFSIGPEWLDRREPPEVLRRGFTAHGKRSRISLHEPLLITIRADTEQLKQFTKFSKVPPEFSILFDGAMFVARCEITDSFLVSDLGYVARDFLISTLQRGNLSSMTSAVGPTPLHPNIYLVGLSPVDESSGELRQTVPLPADTYDIVYHFPRDADLAAALIIRAIFQRPLDYFYAARHQCYDINALTYELENHNEQLTDLLTILFDRSAFIASVARVPRKIRKTLAIMHRCLNRIARAHVDLDRTLDTFNELVAQSGLPQTVVSYLNDTVGEYRRLDRDAQLRLMDYAAAESTNLTVVQATIWASIGGALVGAVVTLLLGS